MIWSLEDGAERRIDLRSVLGFCGNSVRIIDNVQTDTSTGMLYGHSFQCGGQGLDFLQINTLTGEINIQSLDTAALGVGLYDVSSSFLTYGGEIAGQAMAFGQDALVERIESSSAVASALEIQLPVNGATNRVGLTNGTFGDEHAFGVSYARVQGRFDVGLAYAQGDGGRNAGKISVGFSW